MGILSGYSLGMEDQEEVAKDKNMAAQHSVIQLVLPGVDDLSEERIGKLHQAEVLVREVMLSMHLSPVEYQTHLRRKMELIASLASLCATPSEPVQIDA